MRPAVSACVILLASAAVDSQSPATVPMQPRQPAIDRAAVVSRADLTYDKPVARSEEGMPLGNGRMGSLVWTSPSALKFQMNRVDVQAVNRETTSFFERNSDYMGGCGFVDIELGGRGDALSSSTQHLSIHNGLMTVRGEGVTVMWVGE